MCTLEYVYSFKNCSVLMNFDYTAQNLFRFLLRCSTICILYLRNDDAVFFPWETDTSLHVKFAPVLWLKAPPFLISLGKITLGFQPARHINTGICTEKKGKKIQGRSIQKESHVKGNHILAYLVLAAFQRKLSREKTDNTAKGKKQPGPQYNVITCSWLIYVARLSFHYWFKLISQ